MISDVVDINGCHLDVSQFDFGRLGKVVLIVERLCVRVGDSI